MQSISINDLFLNSVKTNELSIKQTIYISMYIHLSTSIQGIFACKKKLYKRPLLRISRFFLTLFSSAVPGPLQPPSPPPTPLNTSTRWFYILDFLSVSGIYGGGGGRVAPVYFHGPNSLL